VTEHRPITHTIESYKLKHLFLIFNHSLIQCFVQNIFIENFFLCSCRVRVYVRASCLKIEEQARCPQEGQEGPKRNSQKIIHGPTISNNQAQVSIIVIICL
jgi:hypothetical protein